MCVLLQALLWAFNFTFGMSHNVISNAQLSARLASIVRIMEYAADAKLSAMSEEEASDKRSKTKARARSVDAVALAEATHAVQLVELGTPVDSPPADAAAVEFQRVSVKYESSVYLFCSALELQIARVC